MRNVIKNFAQKNSSSMDAKLGNAQETEFLEYTRKQF